MDGDALYERFVERYFEEGSKDVPADWPDEVRARCLFFLQLEERVARRDAGVLGESSISVLEETGVRAELDLPGQEGPPCLPARGTAERYVVERELARGGMGRILLAYDRDFRRKIAVKVSLAPPGEVSRTERFVEEAQATAQLEHPNIAPIYDLGVDGEGRPYFTMKWIRGRDLKQVLSERAPEMSLIRLLQILQQACMGVHFANTRGVVHRDLKPQNVMVGDYGEVLVVDWGLAKVMGRVDDRSETEGVSTERAEAGQETFEGTVQGSPLYMSPEQARGEVSQIDARTDVHGLGAILYEILTGSPPRSAGSFPAVIGAARRGDVVPLARAAPDRIVPPALEAACLRALAPRKEDRYASAKELHDALQAFIEGIHDAERRAAEAARLRGIADALREDFRRAESEQARAQEEEKALAAAVKPHEGEERKLPVWDAAARADAAREAAAAAFDRTAAAFRAVLGIDPEAREARAALAEMHLGRLRAAEARGDREAARLHEGLVAQYDDGRYRVELAGNGLLRLASDPPGAEVRIARFEKRGPLLVEGEAVLAGTTPLERALPHGSYVCRLRLAGFIETPYPVFLARSESLDARVRLPREGSVPEGFVHVPGGLTIVGGDGDVALAPLPRARVDVPDVIVARFPVTLGEYCEFLSAEFAGRETAPREHIPYFGSETYVERHPDGRYAPISRLHPRMPLFAIPYPSAVLYCEWLGRRIGRAARLPREPEWERCTRGADGRTFPWGNGFDWSFAKGGLSREGEPFPEAVEAFPRDLSLFGVRALAGCVREYCEGWYSEGYRVLRGGSWVTPMLGVFRADSRSSIHEGTRQTGVGFRVCFEP